MTRSTGRVVAAATGIKQSRMVGDCTSLPLLLFPSPAGDRKAEESTLSLLRREVNRSDTPDLSPDWIVRSLFFCAWHVFLFLPQLAGLTLCLFIFNSRRGGNINLCGRMPLFLECVHLRRIIVSKTTDGFEAHQNRFLSVCFAPESECPGLENKEPTASRYKYSQRAHHAALALFPFPSR